jgi:hypothetical protein
MNHPDASQYGLCLAQIRVSDLVSDFRDGCARIQVGNVYAKFYDEEHADAALKGLDGRYDHLLDPLVVAQTCQSDPHNSLQTHADRNCPHMYFIFTWPRHPMTLWTSGSVHLLARRNFEVA